MKAGIEATCQMYVPGGGGTITFDANANPTFTGSAITMKPLNISVEPEVKEEDSTTIRGPGAGRGETTTATTERATVRLEAEFPVELYEGSLPALPVRGNIVGLVITNGDYAFEGAVRVTRCPFSNPASGVAKINFEGGTIGNFENSF